MAGLIKNGANKILLNKEAGGYRIIIVYWGLAVVFIYLSWSWVCACVWKPIKCLGIWQALPREEIMLNRMAFGVSTHFGVRKHTNNIHLLEFPLIILFCLTCYIAIINIFMILYIPYSSNWYMKRVEQSEQLLEMYKQLVEIYEAILEIY